MKRFAATCHTENAGLYVWVWVRLCVCMCAVNVHMDVCMCAVTMVFRLCMQESAMLLNVRLYTYRRYNAQRARTQIIFGCVHIYTNLGKSMPFLQQPNRSIFLNSNVSFSLSLSVYTCISLRCCLFSSFHLNFSVMFSMQLYVWLVVGVFFDALSEKYIQQRSRMNEIR